MLLLRWSLFLPRHDSFIFLFWIKPIIFCKHKFARCTLISNTLFCNFCLPFLTKIDENMRLVDGVSLETLLQSSSHYLIIRHCLPIHLFLQVLSDHLDFLTIDQGFLQLHWSFHQESFQQFWTLADSFFWYAIQHGVPSDYNLLIVSLIWWLVFIFIPNTFVAYFLYFSFTVGIIGF